jgi:hypothetical protein
MVNPYLERTRYIFRPAANQFKFRRYSLDALRSAQAQWDVADVLRRTTPDVASETVLLRDEEAEEPASKALENRLRVAFLATKGATMRDWISHRETTVSPRKDET